MAQELDKTEKAAIAGLRGAMLAVRDVDPEMPAQTLQTLLEVAMEPGITMADLQKRIDLSSAAMSRIISRLSEWKKHQVPGLNFLQAQPNPMDRRYVIVHPTAKGLAFVRKIVVGASRRI